MTRTCWYLVIMILGPACGSGSQKAPDGSRPDTAAVDAASGTDAPTSDAMGGDSQGPGDAFQAQLRATFDKVTRGFSIDPRAHRDAGSVTVTGAEFGGELLSITVLDSPTVQVTTYSCPADSIYVSYVHLGLAWVSRADMPCTVTFGSVPTSLGEIADGTFQATLVRQDGAPGTMLVENGIFKVQSDN